MTPRRSMFASTSPYVLAILGIGLISQPVRGDQIIADNLIVQGFLDVDVFDTPEIRLIQSAGGGFTPWEWQMSANEFSFGIADLTSGTFPFTIESTALDASFYMNTLGNVGFGTITPVAPIHVIKDAETLIPEVVAQFEVRDDPVGRLVINNNSSSNGIFHPRIQGLATSQATPLSLEGIIGSDVGSNPCVSFNAVRSLGGGVVNRPLVVFRNNTTIRASISANGDMFATSFNPISSRTKKDNIVDLASTKAATALRQLTPVEFVYKDDESAEQRVGFIAEDVPELVANGDRQSVPIMDVVALVTRVVKDQQQTIEQQQDTIQLQRLELEGQKTSFEAQRELVAQQQKSISEQAKSLETLMERLKALESRMQD